MTLPAIRPAVAIATTLGLVQGLGSSIQIMALTGGGPAGATETLATQVYKQAFALGNFGCGAALGAWCSRPSSLIFAVIQQRVTSVRTRRTDMFRYTKLTALREVGLLGPRVDLPRALLLPGHHRAKPDEATLYTTSPARTAARPGLQQLR